MFDELLTMAVRLTPEAVASTMYMLEHIYASPKRIRSIRLRRGFCS